MANFEKEVEISNEKEEKAQGAYGTSRAKIYNNPVGAIAGGVAAWYITQKYTGIENRWAYAGIILLGVVTGAYVSSGLKRGTNNIIF
jgi:hypothetical protein